MGDVSDRTIMTIVAVGIALPLLGWIAGSYIGILPPWYSGVVVPIVIGVAAIVIGIVVWNALDVLD